MDASILLPPTGTPLTGIDFVKRLPCGDVEKTRRVSGTPEIHLQISHTLHILHSVLDYFFLVCKARTVQLDSTRIPYNILYNFFRHILYHRKKDVFFFPSAMFRSLLKIIFEKIMFVYNV